MPVYQSKTPNKDGASWFFSVSYKENGKYKKHNSGKYKTKREAVRAEAEYLANGKPEESPTFNYVADKYLDELSQRVKPATIRNNMYYLGLISEAFGNEPIDSINFDKLSLLRSKLIQEQRAPKSINELLKVLRQVFNFAEVGYGISNSSIKLLKNVPQEEKKEKEVLTLDEFNRLMQTGLSDRYVALFTLLFFTGMRIGEALALKPTDIKGNKLTISRTVSTGVKKVAGYSIGTPKTKNSKRTILLADVVVQALQPVLKDKPSDRYIFGDRVPIARDSVMMQFRLRLGKAGIDRPLKLHDLRHSFVSMMVKEMDIKDVVFLSRYIGHASPAITLSVYSHLLVGTEDEVITTLNKSLSTNPSTNFIKK